MAYVQKDNSGSLFFNDRKQTDNHPDRTGKAMIGGIWYWVSAWDKTGSTEFISLAFKEMTSEQAEKASGASQGGGQQGQQRQPQRQAQRPAPPQQRQQQKRPMQNNMAANRPPARGPSSAPFREDEDHFNDGEDIPFFHNIPSRSV